MRSSSPLRRTVRNGVKNLYGSEEIFKNICGCAIIVPMLDPKFVEENPELVEKKLALRGIDFDLSEFLKLAKEGYFSPYMIATVYTGLGDRDKAFEWLDKAFEECDSNNWFIKAQPVFDDLRSDPRWKKLMEKMGLAE